MTEPQFPEDDGSPHPGITVDDLPAIMRELFDQCVLTPARWSTPARTSMPSWMRCGTRWPQRSVWCGVTGQPARRPRGLRRWTSSVELLRRCWRAACAPVIYRDRSGPAASRPEEERPGSSLSMAAISCRTTSTAWSRSRRCSGSCGSGPSAEVESSMPQVSR